MNRRSFLRSILAAGVAPWVMSNGVASGILMPVRKVVTPEIDMSAWTLGFPGGQQELVLYSGTPETGGFVLARMPLNMFFPALKGVSNVSGSGEVITAGTITHARLFSAEGMPYCWMDVGGPHDNTALRLSHPNVCTGQNVSVNMIVRSE